MDLPRTELEEKLSQHPGSWQQSLHTLHRARSSAGLCKCSLVLTLQPQWLSSLKVFYKCGGQQITAWEPGKRGQQPQVKEVVRWDDDLQVMLVCTCLHTTAQGCGRRTRWQGRGLWAVTSTSGKAVRPVSRHTVVWCFSAGREGSWPEGCTFPSTGASLVDEAETRVWGAEGSRWENRDLGGPD